MKFFKRTKDKTTETPASKEPGYYKNLYEMILNFKLMLDNKNIPYIFTGLNSPLFNGDYNNLTTDEKENVKSLIDDIIKQINFFNVTPDNSPDDMASAASNELVLMSARIFQDIPIYGNMTIH
jgi:hypothetical protein